MYNNIYCFNLSYCVAITHSEEDMPTVMLARKNIIKIKGKFGMLVMNTSNKMEEKN